MKAKTIVLFGILTLLAGSCIPSLFPLYTREDIVFDDRIEGTWNSGGDSKWTIEKLEFHPNAAFMSPSWTEADEGSEIENMHYRLLVEEWDEGDTVEATFILTLLTLDGQMYANFSPQSWELKHDFLAWHMIEANNFAKIGIEDNRISFTYFDPEYLEDLIEQNRIRISHIWLDDFLLITAPTGDLQKFVTKYADDKDALIDPEVFERI